MIKINNECFEYASYKCLDIKFKSYLVYFNQRFKYPCSDPKPTNPFPKYVYRYVTLRTQLT